MWFLSLQIGKEGSKGERAMQALFFFAKATDTEGLGFALIFYKSDFGFLFFLSCVCVYQILGNVSKKNLCPPQG